MSLSDQYLMLLQLFSFADTYRGRYDDSVHSVRKYYPSSTGYSVRTISLLSPLCHLPFDVIEFLVRVRPCRWPKL